MLSKPATTEQEINQLSKNRWSPRAFDSSKNVSNEKLFAICEAGQWAPSAYNEQPWRFIICSKDDDFANWEKLLDCLIDWNQRWAANAPFLIVGFAKKTFTQTGDANRMSPYDTGAAVMNMSIEATNQGLIVHQMSGFDEQKVSEKFNIPDEFAPMSVFALGYQAEADTLSADFHKIEIAKRTRKAISENFFKGDWGNGIV